MVKRQEAEATADPTLGSVQGSGRFFFALATIIFDVIDDELTISDYHKCAGTEVSMSSRALRLGTGAVNKASKHCNKLPNSWWTPRLR
jgi:hypothetical protein